MALSISVRDRHESSGKHTYPTLDTLSWTHKLHLSGKFAFSLATGSKSNRSSAINKERIIQVNETNIIPRKRTDWFQDGCYNKQRKKKFKASDALKEDLENLFLEGFITDGPKQGKNKYTGLSALLFLKNLKLANGRRKYSNDKSNKNGALPTKEYIKQWFSNRKSAMAKSERKRALAKNNQQPTNATYDNDQINQNITNDYFVDCIECTEEELFQGQSGKDYKNKKEYSIDDLKKLAGERMKSKKFTEKNLYFCLLKDDDFMKAKGTESELYDGKDAKFLKNLCVNRNLPSDAKRMSIITFLEINDQVQILKSGRQELSRVILKSRLEEEA